jgi:hypothetical protein
MQKIIFLSLIWFNTQAQNVGIGTSNPTIAKLEVVGRAGTSNTVAAFGTDGAGVSFQSNFPTIGFNQYNKQSTGYGNFMSNGNASALIFNNTTGILSLNLAIASFGVPLGQKDSSIISNQNLFNITSNGNIGIGTSAANNIGLHIGAENFGATGSTLIKGTTYNSSFEYNSTKINGGKAGSKVILNDILGGNVIIGGRTEVNNVYDQYGGNNSLSVSGALAFTKRDEHEVCTGGIYNPGNSSYVNVKRTGCNNAQPFVIANGIVEGQLLIIQAEGNNDFTIYDQNNINLPGNTQMGGGDIMVLIWNGYFTKWEQVSYSNN